MDEHDAAHAGLGLHWLEEPVWPPENYGGLARVRAAGNHAIASGENAGSLSLVSIAFPTLSFR
jgi:D-galactarolactone cycloisomerase